jgi:hypothetical protein
MTVSLATVGVVPAVAAVVVVVAVATVVSWGGAAAVVAAVPAGGVEVLLGPVVGVGIPEGRLPVTEFVEIAAGLACLARVAEPSLQLLVGVLLGVLVVLDPTKGLRRDRVVVWVAPV